MCHVLIIEDEVLVGMHLEFLLAHHGATSFAVAETEAEAIVMARIKSPDFIASDVQLRDGSGPSAVQVILNEIGQRPVIFITGSPEECVLFDPSHRVFAKPIDELTIAAAFREMAPV